MLNAYDVLTLKGRKTLLARIESQHVWCREFASHPWSLGDVVLVWPHPECVPRTFVRVKGWEAVARWGCGPRGFPHATGSLNLAPDRLPRLPLSHGRPLRVRLLLHAQWMKLHTRCQSEKSEKWCNVRWPLPSSPPTISWCWMEEIQTSTQKDKEHPGSSLIQIQRSQLSTLQPKPNAILMVLCI